MTLTTVSFEISAHMNMPNQRRWMKNFALVGSRSTPAFRCMVQEREGDKPTDITSRPLADICHHITNQKWPSLLIFLPGVTWQIREKGENYVQAASCGGIRLNLSNAQAEIEEETLVLRRAGATLFLPPPAYHSYQEKMRPHTFPSILLSPERGFCGSGAKIGRCSTQP